MLSVVGSLKWNKYPKMEDNFWQVPEACKISIPLNVTILFLICWYRVSARTTYCCSDVVNFRGSKDAKCNNTRKG